MSSRVFKGQVGAWWWVTAVLVAALLALFCIQLFSGASVPICVCIVVALASIAVVALFVWVALDNNVELRESALAIRFGPLRMTVPYEQLLSAEEYHLDRAGAVLAFALGRNQVTIHRRGGASIVVAVERHDALIAELQQLVLGGNCP